MHTMPDGREITDEDYETVKSGVVAIALQPNGIWVDFANGTTVQGSRYKDGWYVWDRPEVIDSNISALLDELFAWNAQAWRLEKVMHE